MLAFLFRRLGQSLLVVVVMATLVFVGVYALGNPIDILISPEADQLEREQAIAGSASTSRSGCSSGSSSPRRCPAISASRSCTACPALDLILSRMPATLELAGVALILSIGIGIPLGLIAGLAPKSLARPRHHDRSIFGFSLPNFWLGLMLILAFSVELKWLPAGGRGETREIFGIQWSFAHARRPAPPDPAGAHARDLQGLAGGAPRLCGHARGAAAGLRALRARQGPVAHAASSACTCSRPS